MMRSLVAVLVLLFNILVVGLKLIDPRTQDDPVTSFSVSSLSNGASGSIGSEQFVSISPTAGENNDDGVFQASNPQTEVIELQLAGNDGNCAGSPNKIQAPHRSR